MKKMIVGFIGSGYELIAKFAINAFTPMEAFEKAEKLYKEVLGNTPYCEMEILETF